MENMSGTKLDILWSPVHHDKFIVWGPDITLYEVAKLSEIEKKTTFSQISSTRGATVVASQSASGVRCVDISAIADHPDPLLGLGHASGRVTLASLKQTYDPLGLVGREFVPKYGRPCNGLSWSHDETNLIVVGYDKHRSDNCIQVWDANRSSVSADEFTDSNQSEPARPVAELALSETAHSVAWTDLGNRTLAASMNMKHIKIYDLREQSGTAVGVATSRQCLGVCAARRGWQLASRGEAGVCVWDARSLTRPLLTLPSARPPRKIQWCPTRRNLLLSLQRDSSTLRLHDIQHAQEYRSSQSVDSSMSATPALEEAEEGGARGPSVLEREVSPASQPLAAFCWHPAHEARLLALCLSGGVVEYTVCERVTLAWGARGGLVWAGGGALRLMRDDFYGALQDVSHRMQRRAHTDYGLKPDLWQNADLAEDEALSGLWHFLALSKSLVEDGCFRNSPWKLPGVRTVLRAPGDGGYRSEAVPLLLPDMPNRKVTVYRSAERTCALQLCGWGWGWENAGVGVERAEAEGTPCRAAALAAFHLRTRAALDVLARAQEPRLRVAALALAGPGADERLWRDALSAAAPALPDAYLRALLYFLAATAGAGAAPPDLSAVLNETEMRLEDRVAFACIYLPDGRLQEYVRATCDALTERGDLAGILLTGLSRARESGGRGAAAALGGGDGRRAVGGAAGGALLPRGLAARPPRLRLAGELPHAAGRLAHVVGAVRAGHVRVRVRGRGGRGRGGAARGRGLQLLRQVRGGARAQRPPARRPRAPAAARQQDEDIVVSELPQAAAALRRVPAAPGHGQRLRERGWCRWRGGRHRGRQRGRGRRAVRRLVQLVRGVPTRRPRRPLVGMVQRALRVPGELVLVPLQLAGPARPAVATRPRPRPRQLDTFLPFAFECTVMVKIKIIYFSLTPLILTP